MTVTINDSITTAQEFGFDGCHKIYLINSSEDREQLVEYGYDILPIDKLKEAWEDSCPLRFIENADLKTTLVSQAAGDAKIRVYHD